eukprot:Pgem_evm1s20316
MLQETNEGLTAMRQMSANTKELITRMLPVNENSQQNLEMIENSLAIMLQTEKNIIVHL